MLFNIATSKSFGELLSISITKSNHKLTKLLHIVYLFFIQEFTSKRLIDFLLAYLKEVKCHTNLMHECISICIACDIGNYRPPLFDDCLYPLLSTMNFHQQFDIRLNWPKFALRLYRFGIYHKPLVNEILKQKSHFQSIDADCFANLEAIQRVRSLSITLL